MRRLPFLAANPDLFEQMIDADFVVRRDWRAAVCGIRERTGHRMIRAVLRSVKGKMAVRKLDAAIGLPSDVRIVRDHQNRMAGFVQIAEKINDDLFVGFVKIAGRLVSQNKFRLIDERPRDGHSLLLATGKLRGQMRKALAKTDAFERFRGLLLVRDRMKILSEHDIFERVQVRHQMELLEDEANFLRAVTDHSVFVELRKIHAIDYYTAFGEGVEPAKNIDERGFARARRAHQCDPFCGRDIE